MYSKIVLLFVLTIGALSAIAADPQEKVHQPAERKFRVNYSATVIGLPTASEVRIWVPVPQSSDDQTVKIIERDLPGEVEEGSDEKFGSRMVSVQLAAPKSGEISLSTSYQIVRKEVRGLPPEKMGMGRVKLSDTQRKILLAADSRIPLEGKPLELLKGVSLPEDQLQLARILYDRVDDHVKYDKSRPGFGRGDVLWVCDSRFGNCTDFHSLFISLARAKGLPARFEIGFSIPEKRGEGLISGYHCWAFFYLEKQGWVPVDISEADKNPALKEYYFGNLTENRVTYSQGRDLTLVPKQAGERLNFFIYPYVEVDGKTWPAEKVKLEMTYKDE